MGKGKGRRLKRYLGLRRSQGTAFQGGIDRLLPGRLMGWVMAADPQALFYEVRLLVGPHLIARAEINQPRPDVCEQLGRQGNPGFVLPVPVELPSLDWSLPVRVVAVSADGSVQAELPLMQKKAKTADLLRALLQSDCRGMDGHVDGVQHQELVGWAGRPGQQQPATIWLQADGLEPIGIVCSQWRDGMATQQMPHQCGFSLALDAVPSSWAGKSIWCSFDRAGKWRVPQDQALCAPAVVGGVSATLVHRSPAPSAVVATTYADELASAPEELQEHWRALEDFRLFLDGLEQELNRRDGIKAQQEQVKPQRAGWIARLLRSAR